ncbi:MAG: FmdB family zinc ribbon protein [Dehalococcoidia bacterium]
MPVYEFFCEPCDGVFELLRSIRESSEPASCPVCNRDAKRVMPTSFNAFTFRDGYPRRIPDKGTYWHLGKEVKHLITGPVRPNEHPEINKPIPQPKALKGDVTDQRERARLEREAKAAAEVERQAAIQAFDRAKAAEPKIV